MEDELKSFKDWLIGCGYTVTTVNNIITTVKRLKEDLNIEEMTEEDVKNFYWRELATTRQASVYAIKKYIEYRRECDYNFREFREALNRYYTQNTVTRTIAYIKLLLDEGVNINEVTEQELRAKYWNDNVHSRQMRIGAFRKYLEWKESQKKLK